MYERVFVYERLLVCRCASCGVSRCCSTNLYAFAIIIVSPPQWVLLMLKNFCAVMCCCAPCAVGRCCSTASCGATARVAFRRLASLCVHTLVALAVLWLVRDSRDDAVGHVFPCPLMTSSVENAWAAMDPHFVPESRSYHGHGHDHVHGFDHVHDSGDDRTYEPEHASASNGHGTPHEGGDAPSRPQGTPEFPNCLYHALSVCVHLHVGCAGLVSMGSDGLVHDADATHEGSALEVGIGSHGSVEPGSSESGAVGAEGDDATVEASVASDALVAVDVGADAELTGETPQVTEGSGSAALENVVSDLLGSSKASPAVSDVTSSERVDEPWMYGFAFVERVFLVCLFFASQLHATAEIRYTHTHTYTHHKQSHIHAHTHTYTHAHTHICRLSPPT